MVFSIKGVTAIRPNIIIKANMLFCILCDTYKLSIDKFHIVPIDKKKQKSKKKTASHVISSKSKKKQNNKENSVEISHMITMNSKWLFFLL